MKSKKLKLFIIFIILLFFISSSSIVLADTGFDIDYDLGGGSFDLGGGGFDFDGGYSFGSKSNISAPLSFIIFISMIVIVIVEYIRRRTTDKDINSEKLLITHSKLDNISNIWLDNIETKIPNLDKKKFVSMICEMYIKLQEAWVNFDYETIRSLTTDDLYNSYKSMLESLKRKKQRNIIDDITIYGCTFKNFKEENGKYSLDVVLELAMRDYIVNNNSIIIARGMDVRLDVTTILTIVSTPKNETTKCPVCGAPIKENNQSDVCEFCHNTIVKENYGWLIAKKVVTKQKVIGD